MQLPTRWNRIRDGGYICEFWVEDVTVWQWQTESATLVQDAGLREKVWSKICWCFSFIAPVNHMFSFFRASIILSPIRCNSVPLRLIQEHSDSSSSGSGVWPVCTDLRSQGRV